MIRAYAVEQVRAAEAAEMAQLAPDALMHRAAEGLVQVALGRVPEGGRVVALIGGGDNGGDGLFASAQLAAHGVSVVAVLVGARVHDEALRAAQDAGVVALEWREGIPSDEVVSVVAEADVVLDAILGIGGRPGLPPHLAEVDDLFAPDAHVLAVDVPSGADPSGLTGAPCVFADETVTFAMAKPVHLLPATEPACGLLTVVDIGVREPADPVLERLTHDDVAHLWPVPSFDSDKYQRGVLGLIAGGEQYTGAAVLSATAAVTAGVGMLRYVGPQAPSDLLRQLVPEAVFGDGRVQAWAIGSGMDLAAATEEQLSVARAALGSDLPVLLDAGGLDLIDEKRSAPTLLTPHAGELLRLAKRLELTHQGRELDEEVVRAHPVEVARSVADHLDVTVLLKGAVTIVVPPTSSGLPIRSQADGPSWLATAGAGDVLAGLGGALLAGGLAPLDAGSLAALVHGVAAHDCNPGGPVRASALAHAVGSSVARLLRGQ